MRIAVDAMLLGGRHTGVEVAIAGLAGALGACPAHQFLLMHRPGYDARDLGGPFVQHHAAPTWTASRPGRILWERLCLPAVARRWGADVLHAPGYVLPERWRGPVVLSVYDILAITHPEWCKWSNALHYGRALPRSIRRAQIVSVPSEVVRAEIVRSMGIAPDRIRVVPLGISPAMRPVDGAAVRAVREALGLPERYLLWVGNLEPKKNVPGLVRAFELAAPTLPHDLVIVGKDGWRCGPSLAAIEHSTVSHRIHRLGYVPASYMPALYTGADLLVHWALYEGAGLTPLEAIACGTPAVVSDGGALPEIAGQVAPVVPLGDPRDLAETLTELTGDRRRHAELAQEGRRWAAEFTWEKCAHRTIRLYEEAASIASHT